MVFAHMGQTAIVVSAHWFSQNLQLRCGIAVPRLIFVYECTLRGSWRCPNILKNEKTIFDFFCMDDCCSIVCAKGSY